MAKILLIDFETSDKDRLAAGKFEADRVTTGWKSEDDEDFAIPEESESIFYRIDAVSPEGLSSLHGDVHEDLVRRVANGAKVVCFVGDGRLFQLTNLVGPLSSFEFKDIARPDSIVFNPRVLFHVPLERYRPAITKAWKFIPEAFAEGEWEMETPANGKIEVLAKSADGHPVAVLLRKGAGYFLFLPSFGDKNIEIVEYLLKDKLSFAAFSLTAEAEQDWIENEDYVFPELKGLVARKNDEVRRHKEALAGIDREIEEMKAGGQAVFHRLLKSEGPELRSAVLHAFDYLGFAKVVDVDAYWKNVIRGKEEDIWLIDVEGQTVENSLRMESLTLVLVRSDRNWATDDECLLLQKYKGRRMQEFDNTKMRALLVGNFFSATDPKERTNPFSAVQIEEAQKDGNGLLATYELFKAIKAEKEGKTTKEALRAQLRGKTGLVTFEY